MEGHDVYQQGLRANRAQAQQGLSAASQALLREALHHEHQDRVRLGETHRAVQDQVWSDQSSLDTLVVNKQAAVLHRDDPARVFLTFGANSTDRLDDWVKNVSSWSGIDPDLTLNADDINQMIALLRGINYAEKGRQTVSDEAYRNGITMAREHIDVLPDKTDQQIQNEFRDTVLQAPGSGPASDDPSGKPTRNIRPLLRPKVRNRIGYHNLFESSWERGEKP